LAAVRASLPSPAKRPPLVVPMRDAARGRTTHTAGGSNRGGRGTTTLDAPGRGERWRAASSGSNARNVIVVPLSEHAARGKWGQSDKHTASARSASPRANPWPGLLLRRVSGVSVQGCARVRYSPARQQSWLFLVSCSPWPVICWFVIG